jgi:hypothetical protein
VVARTFARDRSLRNFYRGMCPSLLRVALDAALYETGKAVFALHLYPRLDFSSSNLSALGRRLSTSGTSGGGDEDGAGTGTVTGTGVGVGNDASHSTSSSSPASANAAAGLPPSLGAMMGVAALATGLSQLATCVIASSFVTPRDHHFSEDKPTYTHTHIHAYRHTHTLWAYST